MRVVPRSFCAPARAMPHAALNRLPRGPVLALAAGLMLAGCDTAEERAEGHFARARALITEGDVARATLEFRNVFRLDGEHAAARAEYARMLRNAGDDRAALAQYLRLAEQRPDDVETRIALAELSLEAGDLEGARDHAERAFAAASADPRIRALKASVDYHDGDREAALTMAAEVVEAAPDIVAAQMVLIAAAMETGDPAAALARIDAALTHAPRDQGLHLVRLAALETLGDDAAAGAQLRRMVELFPEVPEMRQALIQWHLRAGDPDGAEAVLRAEADRAGDPEAALEVVRFLHEIRGPEAARAELDRLAAATPDPRFAQARAGLDFAEGRTAEAIAALEALTQGAKPTDAVRDLEVSLAGMYEATGEAARRDALLARVLEADPAHVAALKLRARGEIAADRPDRAIQDMRAALAQAPGDPEVMTITALAHDRAGAHELAGEQLARAVEASKGGVEESLRYAHFLMRDGRVGPAEGVIADALARAPGSQPLLDLLGRIHLERRDWARVRQVAAELRRQAGGAAADPAQAQAAAALATEFELAALQGEGGAAETLARLEDLGAGGDLEARRRLVRAHAEAGDLEAATRALDALREVEPDSPEVRMLQAGLHTLRGETAAAEAAWRALIDEDPSRPGPHQALAALLAGAGRLEVAAAALAAGVASTGGDAELMFAHAGILETQGDAEGAIAVYETLYARDSADAVVANNLASLLAGHRVEGEGAQAAAALDRAYAIARRLRGSDVPQFQDTYGWIAHLRGDAQGALAALEPAARALPGNALVQLHLAEAQAAAGEVVAARASFAAAAAAAAASGEDETRARADARLAMFDAAPEIEEPKTEPVAEPAQ